MTGMRFQLCFKKNSSFVCNQEKLSFKNQEKLQFISFEKEEPQECWRATENVERNHRESRADSQKSWRVTKR